MYYYNGEKTVDITGNKDNLKIAGIVEESIVDGPGIRYVVFTQGCPHNCLGCHNPQTHDFTEGKYMSIDKIAEEVNSDPLLKGITLSGGEPFMQAEKLSRLLDEVDDRLNVITYTGFEYEELLQKANNLNSYMELLNKTDILIDGEFKMDLKDENLMFRGSSNQRAIDVKKSLESGIVVEYEF